MEKIKVGDEVVWGHTTSKKMGFKDFIAFGKVIRIYKSGLGGSYNQEKVASILVEQNEYWRRIGRKKTTIKLSNLALSLL